MNSDSFEKIKPFKLCFNNEIHRISKLPDDFSSLVQTVKLAFKDTLPNTWALQYKDADDDFVMLTNDEDFKAMLECEAESSSKSIKIFVISFADNNGMTFSTISKAESVEYTRLLEKQQEEVKPEQAQEEKILEVEQPQTSEAQKVEEPVKQEIPSPIVEQKVQSEEVSISVEPVILAQNITNDQAYVDVAIDCNVPVGSVKFSEEEPKRNHRECGRGHRHWGSHEERKVARKEKLRGLVNELMMENMPNMVELMQQYIQNPEAFKEKKQEAPASSQSVEQPIHRRVTCDGCGINPIVGVCYKCSVCEDFDYCAKCEQIVEHPHPFLKLKDPRQRPVTIITVLREDAPMPEAQNKSEPSIEQSFGNSLTKVIKDLSKETQEHVTKALGGLTEKIFGDSQLNAKVEEKVEEVIPVPVIAKEEPAVVQEEPILSVSFVREICTIPSKITIKDKAIYKTVSLKNNGRNEWPSNCFVRNIGGSKGQDTKVVPLAPGKDFSCIIILENPSVAGEHTSTWSLAVMDKKGSIENVGEPFTVAFTVVDVAQPKVEVVEPVVQDEKKEVVQEKEYSQEVKEKAQYIKEIFSEVDFNEVLEFVHAFPDMTVDELVENYLK